MADNHFPSGQAQQVFAVALTVRSVGQRSTHGGMEDGCLLSNTSATAHGAAR